MSVRAAAEKCLSLFEKAQEALADSDYVQTQTARFNLWASNIGVFAGPRASLDARLMHDRNAKYRNLIEQLLGSLERNLLSIISGRSSEISGLRNDALDTTPPPPTSAMNRKPVDANFENPQAVADIVASLHRLSITLRKSTTHHRNAKGDSFIERNDKKEDVNSEVQDSFTAMVRFFFPAATEHVCQAVGKAASLRRRRLLFIRQHQKSLRNERWLAEPALKAVPAAKVVPLISQESAGSHPIDQRGPFVTQQSHSVNEPLQGQNHPKDSIQNSHTTGFTIPDSDKGSSIAASEVSTPSTSSMLQDQHLNYPPAPLINDGMEEVACPYCVTILQEHEVSNLRSWRRHVKRDFGLYNCIVGDCINQTFLFDNFRTWMQHTQEHRKQWQCTIASHPLQSFARKEHLEEHLIKEHQGQFIPSRLSTLVEMGNRPSSRSFDACPFCGENFASQIASASGENATPKMILPDDMPRHVSAHLKWLGLAFLRPQYLLPEESEDDTKSQNSSIAQLSTDEPNSANHSSLQTPLVFQDDDNVREFENNLEWSFMPEKEYLGHEQNLALRSFVVRLRSGPVAQSLLQSLSYQNMHKRQWELSEAHVKTYDWLFSDPEDGETRALWDDFGTWLRSGSGAYWITGKAGSGKSTLMKYIQTSELTTERLRHWSGSGALCMSSFFAWRSGSSDQKSFSFLLRSVLFDILQQHPDLISVVFPEEWERLMSASSLESSLDPPKWNLQSLKTGFISLIKHASEKLKMFFLIDGLDELDCNLEDVVECFMGVARFTNCMKFCFSSRPWVIFEDRLQGCPRLRLQDLTYVDIKTYVDDVLLSDPVMQELVLREPASVQELVSEIIDRANGVFLWVRLVVQSLLRGLRNADRVSDLRRRLQHVPNDLENLYSEHLFSIDAVYREQAEKLFQLCQACRESVTSPDIKLVFIALDFDYSTPIASIIDEDILTLPSVCPDSRAEDHDYALILDEMKRRLQLLTRGLLEVFVYKLPDGYQIDKISYLHGSVQDFLQQAELKAERRLWMSDHHWNPHYALFVSAIKSIRRGIWRTSERRYVIEMCLEACYQAQVILLKDQLDDIGINNYVLLLDELDRVASFRLSGELKSSVGHWASHILPPRWQPDFLSLMCSFGIWPYVKKKLSERPSLLWTESRPPLLAFAFILCVSRIPCPESFSLLMKAKVVNVILEQNVNPNERFEGHTLWQFWIHMLHTADRQLRTDELEALRVCTQRMLLWDADSSFSCIADPNIWSTIYAELEKDTEVGIRGCSLDALRDHGRRLFGSDENATSFEVTTSDLHDHGLEKVYVDVFGESINLSTLKRMPQNNAFQQQIALMPPAQQQRALARYRQAAARRLQNQGQCQSQGQNREVITLDD